MILNHPKQRIKSAILVMLFFSCSITYSQHQLESILDQVESNIQRVETSNETTDQSLSYNTETPWRITFLSTVTNQKGNTAEIEYIFNLSDIDKNTVRYDTRKDLIFVQLKTQRQQRFLKVYEDGALQNYENELVIKAIDVDNAKGLVDFIKQAIDAVAETDKGLPVINSFEEGLAWMEEHISPVDIGDEVLEQSWDSEEGNDLRCRLISTTNGKRAMSEERSFNLGDFGEHTIGLEVKGKQVFLEAKIRRSEKFVECWEDGEKTKYASEIKILLEDVDQARAMLSVMEVLVKLAEERLAEMAVDDLTLEDILVELSESVTSVGVGEKSFIQTFKPACLTSISTKEIGGKEAVEQQIDYHLGDLHATSVDVNVSGEKIEIDLKTRSGEKLLQVNENGEAQNYTNDFSILCNGVENMRHLRQLLPAAIEGCAQQLEQELAAINPNVGEQIFEKVRDRGGEDPLLQTLSAIEGDCKWSLTTVDTGSKNPEEKLWEFNNSDLDAASLAFNISRTDVYVEVSSLYKEKIIKAYSDGEPDDYTSSIQVWVENIEQGRMLMVLWEKAIEACRE